MSCTTIRTRKNVTASVQTKFARTQLLGASMEQMCHSLYSSLLPPFALRARNSSRNAGVLSSMGLWRHYSTVNMALGRSRGCFLFQSTSNTYLPSSFSASSDNSSSTMESYPFALVWGPGYIGLAVAAALYGIEICQIIFYLRAFKNDKLIVKIEVFIAALLDAIHFCFMVYNYHRSLIGCRGDTSLGCTYYVSWAIILNVATVYWVAFMVQVFYAERVWIISGRNRIITSSVALMTVLQLALGLVFITEVIRTPTVESAIASAICDAIITISIIYYLRPTVVRKGNYVKQIVLVFAEMGLFTFCNALAIAILYFLEDFGLGQVLSAAPGAILSTSYVNSMLSVLNARKSIRDQQQHSPQTELPTLPTIR